MPPYLADPGDMAATNLPGEVWAVVALIAGLTVILCLAVLAAGRAHMKKVHRLAEDVQDLRDMYRRALRSDVVMADPVTDTTGGRASDEPARKAA